MNVASLLPLAGFEVTVTLSLPLVKIEGILSIEIKGSYRVVKVTPGNAPDRPYIVNPDHIVFIRAK